MLTIFFRDKKKRNIFFSSEKQILIYRWLLCQKQKHKFLFLLKLFIQQGRRTYRDRCLYTNRGRSIYKNYKMSRLALKFFFDNVYILGTKTRNAR